MICKDIAALLARASGLPDDKIQVTATEQASHGDYATNIALTLSKAQGKSPRAVAEDIVGKLEESPLLERTEIAGPGFINFFLRDAAVETELKRVLSAGDAFGCTKTLAGQRVMYEYTDPNPFKVFHIGHLMANAIGEALSRLGEVQGATVVRANYQGDVGRHVAMAMYGMFHDRAHMPAEDAPLAKKSEWLGACYVVGAQAFAVDEAAKAEITELNKKIFEESDPELKELYTTGRRWSLAHFEELYAILGTTFDYYFFESEVAPTGIAIVHEYLKKGVFELSEGATIFDGEKYGLHKRVFINSQGIPTYEAKDLGLQTIKFQKEPKLDHSVIITANEQNDYFNVVMKAISLIAPEIAAKTQHIGHGMMLGPGGTKMSSRKGGVISGEELLQEVIDEARKRIDTGKFEFSDTERDHAAERIAVAAIKYSILRQGTTKNIIFDREQALSFEGESGPYLLYTYARTQSLLRKGKEAGFEPGTGIGMGNESLARVVGHFEESVESAAQNLAPSTVAQYLLHLARETNSYYGREQIIVDGDEKTGERLALMRAVGQVLKNGLTILGIPVLERM